MIIATYIGEFGTDFVYKIIPAAHYLKVITTNNHRFWAAGIIWYTVHRTKFTYVCFNCLMYYSWNHILQDLFEFGTNGLQLRIRRKSDLNSKYSKSYPVNRYIFQLIKLLSVHNKTGLVNTSLWTLYCEPGYEFILLFCKGVQHTKCTGCTTNFWNSIE